MVRKKNEEVPYYLNYPKSHKWRQWRPLLSTTATVTIFSVGLMVTAVPIAMAHPGNSVEGLPDAGQLPDLPIIEQPEDPDPKPNPQPEQPKDLKSIKGEQHNKASSNAKSKGHEENEQTETIKTKPDKLPDTSVPYPTMLLGSMFGAVAGAFLLFSRKKRVD